jgi:hypothetical protein
MTGALAMLNAPPLTADSAPLAVSNWPLLTEDCSPLAVFFRPKHEAVSA